MKQRTSILRKHGRIFYTFLFSYLFVLLIPLLFGVVIYRNAFSAAQSEAQSAFLSALGQTRAAVDGQITEMKKFAASFRINDRVQSMMYIRGTPTPRQRQSFSALQDELITFKVSYSIVKDIDIFFPNGGFVLSTRSRYKSSELTDMAKSYYHMNLDEWLQLTSGVFYQKFAAISNGKGGNDLLYILSLDSALQATHSAVLLITLDSTELLSVLGDQEKGDLFLSWEDGSVMNDDFTRAETEIAAALSHSSMEEKSSVFRSRVGGDSVSILHLPSEIADFEYVFVIRLAALYEKASGILLTIVVYIFLCLAAGIAVSLRFSRQSSDPIDRIIRMLPGPKGDRPQIDRFSALETFLGDLFQRQKELENTLHRQQDEMRNAFFSRLVKGELPYRGDRFADAFSPGIALNSSDSFCVSLFSVMDYGPGFAPTGEADGNSAALADYSVRNIVEELVTAQYPCYVFQCDGMVVCLASSSDTALPMEAAILATAATAVDFFAEKLGMTVAAVVGRTSADPRSIPKRYLETASAMESMLLLNPAERVATVSGMDALGNRRAFSMHLVHLLETAVRGGNAEAAQSALDAMIDQTVEHPVKSSRLMKARLAGISEFALTALERFGQSMSEGERDELAERMLAVKSFEELRAQIDAFFRSLPSDSQSGSKNHVSFERIAGYIRENCFDPNFGLTQIAEHFSLNSSYLSRKFKNYAGVGISEYIQLLRFEKAKDLLRTTDRQIPAIASDVGYYSAQAFSNAFKKATGMSPTHYKLTSDEPQD